MQHLFIKFENTCMYKHTKIALKVKMSPT